MFNSFNEGQTEEERLATRVDWAAARQGGSTNSVGVKKADGPLDSRREVLRSISGALVSAAAWLEFRWRGYLTDNAL